MYLHIRGLVSPKALEINLEQYIKISSYRPNAKKSDYIKVHITFAQVKKKEKNTFFKNG